MIKSEEREKQHLLFLTQMTSKIAGFMLQMNEFMLNSIVGDNRSSILQELQIQNSSSSRPSQIPTKQNQIKVKATKPKIKQTLQTEKPKGPTSSFLIYYHQNKVELAKKFGESNVSKLTKLASTQWRDLPIKQRQKYQKKSDQSKKRYQKQMETYKKKYSQQLKEQTKKRRMKYRAKWIFKKKVKQAVAKETEELIPQLNSDLKLNQEEKKASQTRIQDKLLQK